jgi:acyl-CoA thioester hydrolase
MASQVLQLRVAPEWVDYNGHMNDAEYARVFSLAVDAFWEALGLDEAGRDAHGVTTFTLETHLCYLAEAAENEALTVALDVLDRDAKRFHLFFSLYREDGQLAATSEQMLMAMDIQAGRPTAFPETIARAADPYGQLERNDWPAQTGRRIGIRRR